jgi:glycosyltransferase involved in cell wall biosynthesis
MCNCILEAMAAGTPVVARDIPGNAALIEHRVNGLLYNSPADCVECCKLLLKARTATDGGGVAAASAPTPASQLPRAVSVLNPGPPVVRNNLCSQVIETARRRVEDRYSMDTEIERSPPPLTSLPTPTSHGVNPAVLRSSFKAHYTRPCT